MEKKNSLIKNVGIVMKAWVSKYPIAIFYIILYLSCQICGPFLNTLLSSKSIAAITQGDVRQFILLILGLLFAISFCNGVAEVISSLMMGQKVFTRLGIFNGALFDKAISTDYQNVELQENAKKLGKASNSVGGNSQGPEQLMTQTLNITVTVLGIGSYGTVILMIDWRILIAVLVMFAGDIAFQTHAIKYSDRHREENSEIWRKKNYIRQKSMNINAGKDIRIYQLRDWFHDLLCDVVNRKREYQKKIELRWYFPTISDVIVSFLRDILAYSILIKRVLSGQIDVATFTMYLGLINGFSNWIYSLSGNFSALKKASHEFNDYFEFMDLPERDSKIQGESNGNKRFLPQNAKNEKKSYITSINNMDCNTVPAEVVKSAPEIIFRNVGFKYKGAEKSILNDLSFTIHSGEKIALVGNNGAGKTTIVKLLTGLYEKSEGEILINKVPIEQIPLEQYQDNISVLFQDTTPLSFSLEENISSVEVDETDSEKVWDALEKSGLADKVRSLENKEKTFITQNLDDNGILLSGGETQKLLLAKAIYKNGNFLILDEPTSALDPIAESKIYEEYNEMSEGKTAVFISHRLASTKFCDKIMFLEQGKIAEFGTHEELMALGGKYKEMFDLQSQYYSSHK